MRSRPWCCRGGCGAAFRITSWFYRRTWIPWRGIARRIPGQSRRENFLGYFGPLSLIFLLILWAAGLIFGFALLQYGAGEHFRLSGEPLTFGLLVYHSGETFFTLGYGDIIPDSGVARALAVVESGLGFGFLGVVIGYLPTIYSSFSRREIEISLLDARAGSPPIRGGTAGQVRKLSATGGARPDFQRLGTLGGGSAGKPSFISSAQFLSIATQQSILAGSADHDSGWQRAGHGGRGRVAQRAGQNHLRHGAARRGGSRPGGECALRSRAPPTGCRAEELNRLRQSLAERGVKLREGAEFEEKLTHLRSLYEPYAVAIALNLSITLPPWIHPEKQKDNWQAGPWDRAIQARSLAGRVQHMDDHF